ncbi:KGK domain-containing protein [Nostoc sp. PCC 7107]|uniref:KGK domain-containing protein n=1 Tax=Nostoc sp. PCC 7107 TaxID=317936 RepID=UPI00029EE858|nr:KGK domain-containing protein [Nostoc sp. PCC 7107]AFY40707.1 KGK family protein [Nostoc sp. PCC 7107]
MEENWYLQECRDDDVISSKEKLFKVGKFRETLNHVFTQRLVNIVNATFQERKLPVTNTQEFLDSGLECEILKIGAKAWESGKIRIKIAVEFIPDEPEITEPESPLDDLRRLIHEDDL